ncbi:SWIM zinc finger family protein [Paenibacillus whitsoniae]|uniref:SWIM zinc finger family protein n=1 Tax=Paenibacillus whitsoniae TaxID=2496558 RepID=A0A430JDL5_9BACL|nr:SWIM zinc finger family protein [Paenibacillus whitsoniae]RTE09094.1 SWIM zinc finger family protein [Paenibacillus whitsoniae]
MLKLQIPKNRMNYLIKQIPLHFDAARLEQGWEAFHKGRVAEVDLQGLSVVATVADQAMQTAELNLENYAESTCTCEAGANCPHIGAVFFSLFVPYGRPELLLQQLKQQIHTRRKTTRSAAPVPERKPAPAANVPQEHALPVDWHRFFEGKFHGFSISHQHSIETFYDSALESLPPFAANWKQDLRELYQFHIVLFMMRKIEQFYQETKSSYLSYYHENGCRITAKHCEDKLVECVESMDLNRAYSAEPKHWHATMRMLGESALQGKDSPIDWLFVYRIVWWKLTKQVQAQQEEVSRLETLLAKKEMLPKKRDVLLAARAHFHIMQGETDRAFARLEQLTHPHAKEFFLYVNAYYHEGQWEQVLVWLRWLFNSIAAAGQDDFRTFCQYWLDTTKHLASDSEWVGVMEALLPRSYYYYTAYLLQTNRYRQWVDLQLANRISPLNLYGLELKAIEDHDPALLLPLYHQAAERAVLEKNRASYKTAVRLLKKLHSIYKSIGQDDRWEHYIYRLADKFSRLRAFQEELKKGKWIR